MVASQLIMSCIISSAAAYNIPSSAIYAIMEAEGGKTGQLSKNSNGSYDLGLMQINTLWLPELAKHWGITETEAAYVLVNDTCANINVASWILKKKINEANGSMIKGISYYHSRTPKHGIKYAKRILNIMKANNLLR
ncbi:MAG: lytic transglycosylase domain-containing protein [Alphaproteobacteria bacterium]|jgi:soluble lytic murein transglycosylase-like protein|nr:lytic transglycosylase domain-containing protein [Alphaproteobacteria bacterium]